MILRLVKEMFWFYCRCKSAQFANMCFENCKNELLCKCFNINYIIVMVNFSFFTAIALRKLNHFDYRQN